MIEENEMEENERMNTHLDALEAEAIYIIREVAAECEKPVSCCTWHEGVLSGETAFSVHAYRYDLEV